MARCAPEVEVAWADPARPVRIEAELREGRIPALLTKFALDFPELAGTWSGRGHYVFNVDDPLSGNGSADLALRAQDRAGTMAWRRRVPVDIVRGVANFQHAQTTDPEAERITAQRDLRHSEAGQADVEFRVDTEEALLPG